MEMFKTFRLILFFIFLSQFANSQETLKLSRDQAEAIFLNENMLLIAEKLNIAKSEAMVLQAKLWPNPTLSVEEVNLWATPNQLNVFGEELQGFRGGNFGKNQQLGLSVEQLIITAGKRKKLIALEQVEVDKSKYFFEDLLRNLKLEFRNQLTNLQYLQFRKNLYQSQLSSIKHLTEAYKKQVEQGNIPQSEYIRLKALELEMSKNINEVNKEINESQKELKLLMRLPSTTELEITDEGYWKNKNQFDQIVLFDIVDQAKFNRPDLKISKLEERYYNNLYNFEKAQRTPDIVFRGIYDRGGNFMYNFVGFGLTIDIPLFNRNQGNIMYAQIGIEHSKILHQQVTLSIENEIVLSYQNLANALKFLNEIEDDYESILDSLLISYTNNFKNRNISLLEFLDFFNAYLENKKIILDAGKKVNEKTEELNYSVGKDLIK